MKKVVSIGGGTGNFVVLSGLKQHVDLVAVVSMADDGGSTGILRDDLDVSPPGDARQCLVALSQSSLLRRSLMNYRFTKGVFKGHAIGNIILSGLEMMTGSFEHAIEEIGQMLDIKGSVLPVTTEKVRLKMVLKDGTVLQGEKDIYLSEVIDRGYKNIYLEPSPSINPRVLEAIVSADVILMGPGGWYTSILPNLLVDGMVSAIKNSKALKIFIVNLMNRIGQTTQYCVSHYLEDLRSYFGEDVFDFILVNKTVPSLDLMDKYSKEGTLVQNDLNLKNVLLCNLLGGLSDPNEADIINRNLIRHCPTKLAKEVMNIVNNI